ncbi:hypothetical protein HS1genome_1657 [Sulfodiicoccus acidiphilus]|uniref:Uncharacterized protein n=1 Tax=Sulfodiicoccus acidiphilus TaxID=1670455 RepID=A0A348B516_9CREN|nr:hypothetical protein [Sulfodiicoccus acidiphilus]BBD73268.1 hypothetical protein HS1genome_1657 [Sulfodiicoccus acidiphilus]
MEQDPKLAVYVTANSVQRMSRNEEQVEDFSRRVKKLGIVKVYLENYRDGLLVERREVEKVAEELSKSFEVAGEWPSERGERGGERVNNTASGSYAWEMNVIGNWSG